MRHLTISVEDSLAAAFDRLLEKHGYGSRSEAFRDLVRRALGEHELRGGAATHCIGALSYVYNHHERQLARRLSRLQHAHHDLTVSTLHAHLDHDNCIEIVILRGPSDAVLRFARLLMAQSGVRHGSFKPIPIDIDAVTQKHRHEHVRPQT